MIQPQIFLILMLDSAVSELAGTRVYPLRMPQRGALPAVVYQRTSIEPFNSLNGDSGVDVIRLQVTCWASSYSDAVDLAAAVRQAITTSSLKVVTEMELDTEDPETKSFGVITDYAIWSAFEPEALSSIATFERVTYEGDGVITEIDLPSAIASDGFYLVILNGRVAKEGIGARYTINGSRNKIIFSEALAGGSFKDEGIIIYQSQGGIQFAYTPFVGDGAIGEVELSAPIVSGGLYFVVLNGRIAKEGVSARYTLNVDRDVVLFNEPLAGGDNPDEGYVIYQTA